MGTWRWSVFKGVGNRIKKKHQQLSRGLDQRTSMLITLCFNAYDCCGFPNAGTFLMPFSFLPSPLNTISTPGTQRRQHLGPRATASPSPLLCLPGRGCPVPSAVRGGFSHCASKGVIMLKEVLGVSPPMSDVRNLLKRLSPAVTGSLR